MKDMVNEAKKILIPLYIKEIFAQYGDIFYGSEEKIMEYFLKEDF